MEQRAILKFLRDFARRELKEKKTERAAVYLVKMKSLVKRGKVPDFRVMGGEGARYLVCVFHGDSLRIYFVSEDAKMMGAEDFKGESKDKILAEVSGSSRLLFSFS